MPSSRAASRAISASISSLAAQDLDSDDDIDLTLVNSDDSNIHCGNEGQEEEEEEESGSKDSEEEESSSKDSEEKENSSKASEEEESSSEDSEEEDENEEEDTDGDHEGKALVALGKRKRGRPPKQTDNTSSKPRKIQYTTSIYTAEQVSKAKSSRGPPISKIFMFSSKEPWNTLKSKIRANIRSALNIKTRRLELNQKAASSNIAPQININFPPELVGVLGRPPVPPPAPIPVPAAVQGPAMLIPPGATAGPNLSIDVFCTQYDLDDDICARFLRFKFKKTDSFAYITLTQLITMEFMPGEVAELQVAVAKWAVPAV
ncbi:hypothetical protein B0H11DRAFT_2247502 [Mycena galericulata]|nr:hypothetical protein B0H11DRAFT_2247502 [Mycena galericulata]